MLQAFALLSAVRPPAAASMPAAIPLAEMQAYCGLFGISDAEEFVRLIRAMDDAVIAHAAQRRS